MKLIVILLTQHSFTSHLVSQGCIEAFCNLLGYADTGVLVICLKGLENILRNGEAKEPVQLCRVSMYAQMIHDTDGLDKIENLLTHENDTISETAARLLKSYWLEEDTLPFGIDFDPTNLPGDFDFG
jgi:importin subunit alpha-6/7